MAISRKKKRFSHGFVKRYGQNEGKQTAVESAANEDFEGSAGGGKRNFQR
jgi:hypothetical protein